MANPNPNSAAQRSFAAEPYDSVAAVLASKQITAELVGQTIHTKDGYAYQVAAANATDHHVTTAGGAKLYVQPMFGGDFGVVFCVEQFGAVANLTLDSTEAIQKAVDALPKPVSSYDPPKFAGGGGTVLLQGAEYLTSAPIRITHNNEIQGAGRGKTRIVATGNYDIVALDYGTSGQPDLAIVSPKVRQITLDGDGLAETGISNRWNGKAYPISYGVFEDLLIVGCKAQMHLFGCWNSSFRRIEAKAKDYNSADDEGIIGILLETCTSGNTYGPPDHEVEFVTGYSGGVNNNVFEEVNTTYLKRIGFHIRAISAAHAYSNRFINCNFEQILKQSSAQTYAHYTDTSATPEGLSEQTTKWQGQPIGLYLLGRIAAHNVNGCYFEAIANLGSTTGGVGTLVDDCGIKFAGGASKAFGNTVAGNFFNSNCQCPVYMGRSNQNTIGTNAILLASSGGGYFIDSESTGTLFLNELIGNINPSSTGRYSWSGGNGGIGLNDPIYRNAYVTVNTGAQAGIDLYRAGNTAAFDAIRFRDGSNNSTLARIGFSSGTMRLEANTAFEFVIGGVRNLFANGVTFQPGSDNAMTLGVAANRWSTVYAGTGTINTSDETTKQQIGAIPDEWLDAWGDVQWSRFKFNEAVAIKGEDARWHVGLVAQQVEDAFASRGLDAFEIGLLCFDEWGDEFDDEGNQTQVAGSRYGVRYSEAQAMEAAWVRRQLSRI